MVKQVTFLIFVLARQMQAQESQKHSYVSHDWSCELLELMLHAVAQHIWDFCTVNYTVTTVICLYISTTSCYPNTQQKSLVSLSNMMHTSPLGTIEAELLTQRFLINCWKGSQFYSYQEVLICLQWTSCYGDGCLGLDWTEILLWCMQSCQMYLQWTT
jgi:hypothetical protein